MDSDDPFWDRQIERMLAGYQEPEVPQDRLEQAARRFADLLAKDAVLESNLQTLLPGYEEPTLPAERLDSIGKGLADLMETPARRPARFRSLGRRPGPAAGPAWAWGVAAAAACVLLLAAVLTTRPERKERPAVTVLPAPEAVADVPASAAPVVVPRTPAPPPVQAPHERVQPAPPQVDLPAPRPEPAAPIPPAFEKPRETVAEAAPADGPTVESAEGAVEVVRDAGRVAARAGHRLLPGESLDVGKAGSARLSFPDGTRVEAGADTVLRRDKALAVVRGMVTAAVARQPAGQAFVIATPNAEAKVLGTRFTLVVTGESTRLDVREGKVRLTRTDGATVDVSAGQFAVAARGIALLPRPIPEEPKTVFYEVEEFGTARGTKPADGMVRRIFLEPFDTASGGWCVAVPASGMEVVGDVRLPKGTWHLWLRYRDEPGNTKIAFNVLLGDQVLGQGTTPGRARNFQWKRFTFAFPGGTARVTLRSTYEGVKATPDRPDFRQSPYGALNRWDRICLTPDEGFTPE